MDRYNDMKNLSSSFFTVPSGQTSVETGDMLVAEPFLRDKWFNRSVITIIDNDEDDITGVVMNNELATTLSDLFKDIETPNIPVYCGGPLGHDRLFFLHTLGENIIPSSKEITPGLWLGGKFAPAVDFINTGYPHEGSIRFFIGYSGWTKSQLAEELKENTWAVPKQKFEATSLLSGEGDKYWRNIVKRMGDRYRPWTVLPQDSRAN